MNTLYNSDSFAVVHVFPDAPEEDNAPAARADAAPEPMTFVRQGFEIVDKRTGKGLYLDGAWADMFEARLLDWQKNLPTQEEVEDALEGYAALAQTPILVQ